VQAWDEVKATRKGGWPLVVYFALVALTKALAYGRDKLQGMPGLGWIARRLSIGKTAMIVSGSVRSLRPDTTCSPRAVRSRRR
jgi:hypothetical protein